MDIQVKQAAQGYRAGVGALVCVACCNTKTISKRHLIITPFQFHVIFPRAVCVVFYDSI